MEDQRTFKSLLPDPADRVLSMALHQVLANRVVSAEEIVKTFGGVNALIMMFGIKTQILVKTIIKLPASTELAFELTPGLAEALQDFLLEHQLVTPEKVLSLVPTDDLVRHLTASKIWSILFDDSPLRDAAALKGITLLVLETIIEESILDDDEGDTYYHVIKAIGPEEFDRLARSKSETHQYMARLAKLVFITPSMGATFFAITSVPALCDALPLPALLRVARHWARRNHWISEMETRTSDSSLKLPRPPRLPPGTVPGPKKDEDGRLSLVILAEKVVAPPRLPSNRPHAPPPPPEPRPSTRPTTRPVPLDDGGPVLEFVDASLLSQPPPKPPAQEFIDLDPELFK